MESYYLIENMIEQNIIEPKIIIKKRLLYFMHYEKDEEKLNKLFELNEKKLIDNLNISDLKKNDWELHKTLIIEGHNPNEIAKIIRNDEIEKLQEISSQTNFDFNQKIKPSLYEICSFINQKNVTLIDYAAFFSSVKCFKYLLINNAKVENAGKYAVAGGNEEIIHLCEQNHSSFEYAYEAAIMFHQNEIFKYIYENKINEIDFDMMGKECIEYHNYEIFSFLEKEGMKINESIINESARNGNIFLTKYLIKENPFPKNILVYSTESGNIEHVNYILDRKGFDINAVNMFLFYLKLVF